MDFFIDFLSDNFSNCVWLAVLLVAMCPTLESKIAIPLAMNTAIWGSNAFSPLTSFLLSFLGSIIPCYIIIIIVRHLKQKTTGFITSKFIQKYALRGKNIQNKNSDLKKYIALGVFVAIPLPLTGVWTGSLIAGISNLNIHYSFLAIAIGAIISSASVTLLCTIFENSISYIFMISLFIIIVVLLFDLIFSLFDIKKKNTNKKP